MTMTPEELRILQRIETQLETMPFYVAEYVRSKKRAGLSPNTLHQYLYHYKHFFSWLIEESLADAEDVPSIPYTVLAALRKEDIEYYIDHLRGEAITLGQNETKNRGDGMVANVIHALKSLFNYLTKETETESGESYFDRNVMSKIVLHSKKETASRRAQKISSVILNDTEIHDFLHFVEHEYLDTLNSAIARSRFLRDKERDLAILHLFLGSGLRLGELARILTKKLNLKKKMIDVRRKGAKEGTINVLPEAIEYLRRYMDVREARYRGATESPFLFVSLYKGVAQPLSRRAIEKIVAKYTGAFSESEGISPHKLRHSFATDYIRSGGSLVLLRDQLGHSNFEATSLYTNLSNRDGEEVLNKMEQRQRSSRIKEED